MTERIEAMLEFIRSKKHHNFRRISEYPSPEKYAIENINPMMRVTKVLQMLLEREEPVIIDGDRILFWRTVENLADIFTDDEWGKIKSKHFIHESGRISNLSPNYESVICNGLILNKNYALESILDAETEIRVFYECVVQSVDAVLDLTERYRIKAIGIGNIEAANILSHVPAHGARNFREALQSLRIIHFTLWCEGEYHNTLGRFDQYMYPYLRKDLESGLLTEEEAFELLEEFFISLNRDSDLYPGIQQGDNGQSIMLGGVDSEGKCCFNKLSEMCLDASRELKLIDPKINLRVDKNTPLWVFEKGTMLTKEGLGFPQYSNDDIVIPGLIQKGYDLIDARNYAVAACWEFIIPGYGADIPNISAINFPQLVSETVLENMNMTNGYEEFFSLFTQRLIKKCQEICDDIRDVYFAPAPFMSILMNDCIDKGKDISEGNKYNNYGFHGVGLSTAVDSLLVVKQLVFEQNELTYNDIKSFIQSNNEQSLLLPRLRHQMPKFGNDDEKVDIIAVELLAAFADAVKPLRNDRGGCIRAGTGSAMFYLWYAENIGNALSGHRRGESFAANYAPEIFVKNNGPLSVINSFTKPDLKQVINGGPLTMEFHSSIFRDKESIQKVASLIMAFVKKGGHQLQLNSVNRGVMIDAQKHPEKYHNLIVRIWGWSAYFIELDKEYQDHVIARQEFSI